VSELCCRQARGTSKLASPEDGELHVRRPKLTPVPIPDIAAGFWLYYSAEAHDPRAAGGGFK
jgi:hypothetical protein